MKSLFHRALAGAIAFCACAAFVETATAQRVAARTAFVRTEKVWPSPSIAVCWEAGGYALEKQIVRSAIERTWERESRVDFTEWAECDQSPREIILGSRPFSWAVGPQRIHIAIRDEQPHTKGLGRELWGMPGGMVLNFSFSGCPYPRAQCIATVAVHEFGHALGFAHEQNRPDSPAWCREPQGSYGDVLVGSWDLDSVMNYCNPRYGNNGQLSATDIRAVRLIYGSPPPRPRRVSTLMIASCKGEGGVEGLTFWGPFQSTCNNIDAWGLYDKNVRTAASFGSCTGYGGVEGVRLYGPSGEACAGLPEWGVYTNPVSVRTEICGCLGRGDKLDGMVLWGPRGAACGGFAEWGAYNQYCVTQIGN